LRNIVFLSCLLFIVAGCADNSRNDDIVVTKVDTTLAVDAPVEDAPAGVNKLDNSSYTKGLNDLSAETDIEKLLCQGWEMEDDQDVLRDNDEPEGIYPFRSFYLADDHTFIHNPRNFMEYGHWSYNDNDKTVVFRYSNGHKDEYKIAAIGPQELIVINSGINSVTKLTFVAAGKRYGDNTADPYYIENNRWRMKPRFSESDEQIRKRLKDCIHFYILFYRDNLAREENTISFYGFPTCIKWYAGGIYIVKQEELADNWLACFYSKAEAIKAYKMMDDVIGKKYQWSKANISWVKKNLQVLEQMYANL